MRSLKSVLSSFGFALVAALLATPATAALDYQAGAASPAGPGVVSIPIYLHEAPPPTIAAGGLFSIGVSINRTSGDATITSFVRNPAFDQQNPGSTNNGTSAFINAEQNANFGNGVTPDGSGLILLGTATISQGSVLSHFNIGDFGAGDQTVDYGFIAHDAAIAPGLGFDVAAVPEPAALALAFLAAPMTLRRRR